MFRWLRRTSTEPVDLAPQLTPDQVQAWRDFVVECNSLLAEQNRIPGLHHYSQQIRDAVIHKKITVEQFLAANPAPWRR